MKLKALIYDFDGPINDSFREYMRRIRQLCAKHEVAFGRQQRRSLAQHWGLPGVELLQVALDITPELAKAMYVEWERIDLEDPVPLIPGAKEVLRWAERNGFVNCLLTTRNRQNVRDIMKRVDLLRSFRIVSCKQDAVYRKPDPRAFWHVRQELKDRHDVTFRQCVFVGDAAIDVRAGNAAGLRSLVVRTGPYIADDAERVDHPDLLPSIDELPAWLAGQSTGRTLEAFI